MITIIIPSYNQQEFLPQAIESALKQKTNEMYEVVVVDDGSTDNSLAIARSYEKDGVIVISQVNKGLASARNTGIMNCDDEFTDMVLPLDADDTLKEDAVQRIIEKRRETNADVIGLSFKTFGTAETEVILMPEPKLIDFMDGNRLAYCSAISLSALREVGGYSSRMTWGYEDLHLWINLLSRGKKIVTIPEILWNYRMKENSMITTAREHHQELLAQINKDFPQCQLMF